MSIPNMVLTIKTSVVVDDDPHITELFSEILGIHGLEILDVGHNGLDAIDLYMTHKPDILFLDVEMPKLNGIEATVSGDIVGEDGAHPLYLNNLEFIFEKLFNDFSFSLPITLII